MKSILLFLIFITQITFAQEVIELFTNSSSRGGLTDSYERDVRNLEGKNVRLNGKLVEVQGEVGRGLNNIVYEVKVLEGSLKGQVKALKFPLAYLNPEGYLGSADLRGWIVSYEKTKNIIPTVKLHQEYTDPSARYMLSDLIPGNYTALDYIFNPESYPPDNKLDDPMKALKKFIKQSSSIENMKDFHFQNIVYDKSTIPPRWVLVDSAGELKLVTSKTAPNLKSIYREDIFTMMRAFADIYEDQLDNKSVTLKTIDDVENLSKTLVLKERIKRFDKKLLFAPKSSEEVYNALKKMGPLDEAKVFYIMIHKEAISKLFKKPSSFAYLHDFVGSKLFSEFNNFIGDNIIKRATSVEEANKAFDLVDDSEEVFREARSANFPGSICFNSSLRGRL